MKVRSARTSLQLFLLTVLPLLSFGAFGQASVSRSVSDIELCPGGSQRYLGIITLSENTEDDFSDGEDQTLILTLPVGFSFREDNGIVQVDGGNISNPVYFTSGNKLFVKYDISGTPVGPLDKITLNGFRVIPSTEATSGQLLRTGGTADINGGAISDNLVYSSLLVGNAYADAGTDATICTEESIQLGTPAVTGFSYSWVPFSTLDDATSAQPVASPESETTYILTVTDSQGCEATDEVTISVNPVPAADITVSGSTDLCGDETVTLMAPPSSGTYLWSTGATTQNITVSTAGTYTVQVEENGCSHTSAPIEVTVSSEVVLSVSASDNVVCADATSTSVNATISGWTTAGTWSGGFGTFTDPTSLSTEYIYADQDIDAGLAELTFTSENPAGSCNPASESVTIVINPELVVNAGNDRSVCRGESVVLGGGTIASGGNGNYSYAWFGPDDFASSDAAPLIIPAASGTYALTVTDGLNCSQSDEVTITVDEPVAVSIVTEDQTLCPVVNTIVLEADLSGGAPAVAWSGGNGVFSDPSLPNTSYTISEDDIAAGEITLTVATEDPVGNCTASEDFIQLSFYESITADAGENITICTGKTVVLGGEPAGGTGNYQYEWTGPSFTSDVRSPEILFTQAGTFEYTLVVTDGSGCKSVPDVVTITVNDQVTVEAGADRQTCEYESEIVLEAVLTGPVNTGVWTGGSGTFADQTNPSTTYTISEDDITAGAVVLTFTADDADGTGPCDEVRDSFTLTITPRPEVVFAGLADQYAENEPLVTLTGFPDGGTFSGDGIIAGTSDFHPGKAQLGLNEVVYSYSNASGCVNADTQLVIINSVPEINFGLEGRENPVVCVEEGLQKLVYDNTQNGEGTFSGVGVDPDPSGDFYFDPAITGQGVHKVFFTFTTYDPPTTSDDTLVIQVYENPVADFSYDRYVCAGEEIIFTNTSTISPNIFGHSLTAFEWEYGNDEFSSDTEGSVTYTEPGQYAVTLTAYSETCESRITQMITVGGDPAPEFRWEDISEGNVTRFFDETENTLDPPTFVTEWLWDFGDAASPDNTSDIENPTHTFTGAGEFNVSLTVTMNTGCQESVSRVVQILPSVVTYPYFQDFETTGGWVPIDGSSWELGTPSGSHISQPYSGSRSWTTNLDGEYPNDASEFINGPDFDLSVLDRPMLSFYYKTDLQSGFDGVVMQYSLDGGRSWKVLGKPGDGYNWFNEASLVGNPGNQVIGQYGWSGESEWKRGSVNLNALNERTSVRLRLAFGSDASNPPMTALEGFSFDDFYVGERRKQVLTEHFIDGYSESRLEANETIENIGDEVPFDVVQLQYRTNIEQSSDTLFTDARDDISARISYYGVTDPLRSVVDGNYMEVAPNTLDSQEILRRSLEEPAFDISVDTIQLGPHQLGVEVSVEALQTYSSEVIVHIAIVEDETPVNISGYRTDLNYVVKKLLPDAGGNSLSRTWTAGDTEMVTETWQVQHIDNPDALSAVVFIQNKGSREVLQSTILPLQPKSPDIIEGLVDPDVAAYLGETVIYPNPADRKLIVDFNTPLENDLHWKLIDPSGKELRAGDIRRAAGFLEVETDTMPNGLYFLVISEESAPVLYEKVIIRHD
ncbi:MAG: PKD domain-containing protein [Cyclobacteriaceae bacterium]